MVVTVRKGSAAARPPVGQIISRVDGKVVKHPSKCVAIIGALRKKKQTQIDFDIEELLSAAQVKARNKVVQSETDREKELRPEEQQREARAGDARQSQLRRRPFRPPPVSCRPPCRPGRQLPTSCTWRSVASDSGCTPPAFHLPNCARLRANYARPKGQLQIQSQKYEKKAADLKVAYEKELIAYFSNEQNQSMANPFGKVHVTRKSSRS